MPTVPEVFAALDADKFVAVFIGSATLFGRAREWEFTCRDCGKIFRPLPTSRSVELMQAHLTIVKGQPQRCAGAQ